MENFVFAIKMPVPALSKCSIVYQMDCFDISICICIAVEWYYSHVKSNLTIVWQSHLTFQALTYTYYEDAC